MKGEFHMPQNYTTVKRTCLQCNAEFTAKLTKVTHGEGLFCSQSCSSKHQTSKQYPPVSDRFWSKVAKTETCWLWTGLVAANGYGRFSYKHKDYSAHRFAYELAYGPIPKGMQVCHHCDNRLCVRFDTHLFLGTALDNQRDKVAKGRQAKGASHGSVTKPDSVPRGENHLFAQYPEKHARGEKVGASKLTDSKVLEIRRRYAAGDITAVDLAKEFGVSPTTVGLVVQRRAWTHI